MKTSEAALLAPPPGTTPRQIEGGEVWTGADGIVRVTLAPDLEATLEQAREMIAYLREVGKGEPVPVLVDLGTMRRSDAAVRSYLASPEAVAVHRALALLVVSPVARALARAFVHIQKPPYPTRLFPPDEIEKAEAWLTGDH